MYVTSNLDIWKLSHSMCAILIGHSTHYQTLPHTYNESKSFTVDTFIYWILSSRFQGGGGGGGVLGWGTNMPVQGRSQQCAVHMWLLLK